MADQQVVFITSPLEVEHVERMRAVAPERVEILYEPDLLPPVRYIADHHGVAGFELSEEQRQRWDANLRRAMILWDFPYRSLPRAAFHEVAPNVQWVQTTSSGVGQLVTSLGLQDSDLLVTTASGIHANPLAEYVFMVLLIRAKDLELIRKGQAERTWERYCTDELDGKTLAIIGAGRIGRRIVSIARAFGMRTLATARTASPARAAELGVDELFAPAQLHEMLAQADAVVLCVPHTPETENMIDAAALDAMRDGVTLINIARGPVVNDEALQAALRSGKVGFAALDVFRTEPLPPDSPYWSMPNVMVSPHSASTSYSENRKITDIFCHNLACYLEGRFGEMWNVLDKARMY